MSTRYKDVLDVGLDRHRASTPRALTLTQDDTMKNPDLKIETRRVRNCEAREAVMKSYW